MKLQEQVPQKTDKTTDSSMEELLTAIGITPDLSSPEKRKLVTDSLDVGQTAQPFPFYAFLLGAKHDEEVAAFSTSHWNELHRLSGKKCLLFSIYPPLNPDKEIQAYWKDRLGKPLPKKGAEDLDLSISYTMAKDLNIKFSKLPCLHITDSPAGAHGVTLKLPKWNEQELLLLFHAIFDVLGAVDPEDPDRLKQAKCKLENHQIKKVGSYVKEHWKEYRSTETMKKAVEDFLTYILATMTGSLMAR